MGTNEQLAHRLAKEYLRGLRLTGILEQKLGMDMTDYRPNLCDPMLSMLGISEANDKLIDIIDKYEEKVINMTFFQFIETNELDRLVNGMIAEIIKAANC